MLMSREYWKGLHAKSRSLDSTVGIMDDFQRSATVLAALAITAAMHADLATKAFSAPLRPTLLGF
jgi:hypothetical protein